MQTILLVPTDASFVQDLLPKKLAATIVVLQKKIIIPVQEKTRTGQYELKIETFCLQLLKIKKLPPVAVRFLKQQLRKTSSEAKTLIPFEAVDQEISFGVVVASDRSCTLCF